MTTPTPPPPAPQDPLADLFRPAEPARWKTGEIQGLSRAAFIGMLRGEVPAVQVPGFVTRESASRFERHIQNQLAPYAHIAGPPVQKLGLAQFEFQAQSAADFESRTGEVAKDEYFKAAETYKTLHSSVHAATGDDAWSRVVQVLRELLPEYPVIAARESAPDGRAYHAGIYRSINEGTPVHCDWSPFDSATENWVINRVTRQAVFNLYLAPMESGATTLYDRQWDESVHAQYRDPATYGYFDEVVAGRDQLVLRPGVGDLVFFNTRNLHRVDSVAWEDHATLGRWQRPRLTLSSFIGLLPAGVVDEKPCVVLWS
ncbi:hypothetical protein B0H66DRAFT_552865 [Apodospora peruviana]|uniref:Uncharacterized protein n=1 Tax=Apodospora peruviana TaxID=516989 RepID=A0AAE0ICT6_9PEZI|nr:hypothetical protein B0H66DRAFT_552865 [Apodospora peruviana]